AQTSWKFGKDVQGAKLQEAKAEATRMRGDPHRLPLPLPGLLTDLEKQTVEYKDALNKLLTAEQKGEGPVKEDKPRTLIDVLDLATMITLTAVGACLLLGLFSRTAAFLGAGFMLMTYLAVPPWPWLPKPPPTEGSVLFVNKNAIEMLALCVLATVPSGRWFGLDAILSAFWSLIRGKKPSN